VQKKESSNRKKVAKSSRKLRIDRKVLRDLAPGASAANDAKGGVLSGGGRPSKAATTQTYFCQMTTA